MAPQGEEGGRVSYTREQAHAYYLANKEKWHLMAIERAPQHRQNVLRRRQYRTSILSHLKELEGCQRCGGRFVACQLHFHHRDPEVKADALGQMKQLSWPRIFAEICKCEILCANCHALATQQQRVQGAA